MRSRSRLPLLVMLIGVAAIAVLVLHGGSSYVVRAEFADASGLRPDYTVRLDGVTVGRVASVTVTARTTAMVTLDLDASAAPVGRDASASIQPSNLLGEKFVALNRGNTADPAQSGTLIPLSRTSTPTELDQVISTFDPQAREALAVFLSEEGDALLGRGHDLATTLARLPGGLQSITQLVEQLGSESQTLGTLIDQSDRIVGDVAAQRPALGRLVASASGAFATFAGREHDLGATIAAAPATLAQLRTTLVALRAAAGPVAQAAIGLRATAAPLTATLRAVPAFTIAALPALRTVQSVSPSLTTLGAQATPVLRHLNPVASSLQAFATALDPVSAMLNTGIGNLLGLMEGWDRAIQDRDASGHVFRPYLVTPPNAIIQGLLGTFIKTGSLRRAAASPGALKPAAAPAPAPTQAAPPATATAQGATATASKPTLTQTVSKILTGVTGLAGTPAVSKLTGSVSNLLGYLLHR